MFPPFVAYALVFLLAALNAYLDVLHVRATHRTAIARPPPPERYSFVDEDYVPRLPLPSARRAVKLTLEDSARYSLWAPEADDEWLWTATVGDGNVHLGRNSRFFVVGITHQLHCMRAYRQALEREGVPHGHAVGHLTHCLNFLRLSTLCAADTTLEPPDALSRDHRLDPAGGEHVCLDWPAFYEEMKENYLMWVTFQEGLGQGTSM
ncbi:hypothetical protein BV20DRAFT_966248 [Pilatotrama ljubarskyi]|nr:hypothetical protein BV20DRAFT_966248 [Pilatotrama ljubarskyi]